MKYPFRLSLLFTLIAVSFLSCKKSTTPSPIPSDTFIKGADVSWITEMEASGKKFYNVQGAETEGFKLMKDIGFNAIRLRVWVNPADGWCSKEDLLAKAIRAHRQGLRIMVDFHYSDWWADPAKQNKPAAWQKLSFDQLKQAVANHTTEVLTLLKNNGITVEWVQVGNETNTGMLWPEGQVVNNDFSRYAQLNNSGYDAAKKVYPKSLVVVQHGSGADKNACSWFFGGLKAAGGRWDVTGLSVYPSWANLSWQECNKLALENMNALVEIAGKPILVCEAGYPYDKPEEGYSFLLDLIAKTKLVKASKGIGVMYWEPQCYTWKDYSLGAFDATGKPSKALVAFK